jgi:hypothetical protein
LRANSTAREEGRGGKVEAVNQWLQKTSTGKGLALKRRKAWA